MVWMIWMVGMGVAARMLSGFNTNVRHRGVVFHVQTEDSGRAHPHVITHLYHGGTILASEKRGYAEVLQASDLATRVRALMEAQHAAMLERLRGGELDAPIAARLGPGVFDPGAATSSSHTQRAAAARAAVEAPAPAAPAPQRTRPAALDEMILDYLVEATRRGRERRGAPSAGRGAPFELE